MTDEMRPDLPPAIMAMAAWKELSALQSKYTAAVFRTEIELAERIRAEAHDLLDACLDLNGQVAEIQMMDFIRPLRR